MWIDSEFELSSLSVKNSSVLKSQSEKINGEFQKLLDSVAGFQHFGKKCAFVTMASPSYDFALKVLLPSIRRHSAIPIIVLTNRRWTFRTKVADVYFMTVPNLYNERYSPDRPEFNATLTKLWIFGLLCFDRMVFLDADSVVVKSIDDLFEQRGLCAAPDCIEESEVPRFNSGLMAFDSSAQLRDLIFENAYGTTSYDHGDQGLLNSLLRPIVNFLPSEYNFARHYSFFHGPEATLEAARVVHYTVKKPWELWYRETPDVALVELDDFWTQQLTHEELLQLVAFWRRRQFIAERPRLESLRQHRALSLIVGSSRRVRYFFAIMGIAGALLLLSIVILQVYFLFGRF